MGVGPCTACRGGVDNGRAVICSPSSLLLQISTIFPSVIHIIFSIVIMYIMTIVVVVAARVVEVGIDTVLVRWGFRPAAL